MNYIDLLHVSGGEPFLYPHLGEFLEYIDVHHRQSIHQLATTTNGTIDITDEMCVLLREHNVLLICDDYTEALPQNASRFQALITRLERNSVWHFVNKAKQWIDLAPSKTDNSNMTEEELRAHCCKCANPYQEYYGGKLYACNYSHYAEKAGLCIADASEYLDFSSLDSKPNKELVEFRLGYSEKGYMGFCKRCAGFSNNSYVVKPAVQEERGGHRDEAKHGEREHGSMDSLGGDKLDQGNGFRHYPRL